MKSMNKIYKRKFKSKGKIYTAIVDWEDRNILNQVSWCILHSQVSDVKYVYRNSKLYKPGPALLHRLLLKIPKGKIIDHINHNGLDNRRCNLRVCTVGENQRNNIAVRKTNTSGYTGVVYKEGNYVGRFQIKYKTHCTKSFKTKRLAAIAREKLIDKIGDVFVRRNNIKGYNF